MPLTDRESIVLFRDHLTLVGRVMVAEDVAAGSLALAEALAIRQREFASRMGVRLHDETPDGGSDGICHTLVLERYALPGQVLLGTDSHTCTNGAMGALAFGVGTTEGTYAMATGHIYDFVVPETIRFETRAGSFRRNVTPSCG